MGLDESEVINIMKLHQNQKLGTVPKYFGIEKLFRKLVPDSVASEVPEVRNFELRPSVGPLVKSRSEKKSLFFLSKKYTIHEQLGSTG